APSTAGEGMFAVSFQLQQHDRSDRDHRQVVGLALFVAGRDPAPRVEPVDGALHPVALAVGGPVEAALARLVGLARDHRPDAAAAQVAPQAGEAIALVARDRGGGGPGPAPRPPDRAGLHERTQHRRLVALPGGGQDHHRLATAFDPKVQLGGVATAAAAPPPPPPPPTPRAGRTGGGPPRLAPPGRPQAAAAWPRQRAGGLAPPTRRRNAAASPARPARPHRPAGDGAPWSSMGAWANELGRG